MNQKLRSFVLLAAIAAVLSLSGCASAVMASLHGKLPIESAATLKVSASIAAVGGGTFEATNVTTDPVTGQVTAGIFHESVNTGGGSLVIDGTQVKLKRLK